MRSFSSAGFADAEVLFADFDVHIGLDGHQEFAQRQMWQSICKSLPLLRREFVQMLLDAFQTAVFCNEFARSDLAYAVHSLDVVGRVAPDGKYVDYLERIGNAISGTYLIFGDDFVLGTGFGQSYRKGFRCQTKSLSLYADV